MGTTKLRGKRVGKSPLQLQSGQISGVEMNDEQRERRRRRKDEREGETEGKKRAEREKRGRKGERGEREGEILVAEKLFGLLRNETKRNASPIYMQ